MCKLSKTQAATLKDMKEKGYVLATNEGANLRCWLEDKNGRLIKTVRMPTINVLANLKIFEKGDVSRLFFMQLS